MANCSSCVGNCKGGCNTTCRGGKSSADPPSTCNGTCWAQCGGGSCSGVSAKVPPDDKNYNDRYGSGDGKCWCGSDCAGCGGCSGGCSGCTGGCSGCGSGCGGSCTGTCSNGCSYTCTGSCKGYCKGECSDGCKGGCKTACSGTCQHLCNVTCISDVAADAYDHLVKIETVTNLDYTFEQHLTENPLILDWLDADDMRYLFGMIQEEGRRRVLKKTGKYTKENTDYPKTVAQALTRNEEQEIGIRDKDGKMIDVKVGEFADDEKHIKKLLNMYADNTGKAISLSVGGTTIAEGNTIRKSIGRTLIEKALASYREKIAVNTTSEESGRQTKEDK